MTLPTSPYTIKLWAPFNVAYADADFSITIKAPERGNTELKARNQSFARTRAGNTWVYDRGRNYNDTKKFQFRDVQDSEKAQLQVFLDAIQWGSTKLSYQDWNGEQFVIRVDATSLNYIDQGYIDHNTVSAKIIVWDFDLQYMDLTDNTDELDGADIPVSNALALHLTDFNHPHNPKTTLAVTTTPATVEQFKADDWDLIAWHIVIVSGANKAHGYLHCINNNVAGGADATVVDTTLEILNDPAGLFSVVTFTADLTGTGTSQMMRLNAIASSGTRTVKVRRFKL